MQYYLSSNTNFDKNGDLKLQPTTAILNVELNGICEVTVTHEYDKEGRWKKIENLGVIKTKVCYTPNEQLFRIYDVEKNMSNLTFKARHIFFDLVNNVVVNKSFTHSTAQEILNSLLEGTKFTAKSDIVSFADVNFKKSNVIKSINGSDTSLVKIFKGELFLDNFNLIFNQEIGQDYGVKVKYAWNMANVDLTENTDSMITRAYPFGKDDYTIPQKYIESPLIKKYPIVYENFIDLSNYALKTKDTAQDNSLVLFDTEEELNQAIINEVNRRFSLGCDRPTITGTVDMISLENTEEYSYFSDLVNVSLGDIVTIEHKNIGIETKSRCVAIEWDILTGHYNKITLGELKDSFFDIQSENTNKLENILNDNGTVNAEKLQGLIDGLKAQFNVMRSVAQPQQVRALLFEDKVKGSVTYGALAIGTMGIEIASERTSDDKDWNWKTFITGTQVVADYLVGKLRTVLIENIDSSFQVDLSQSGGANFYNNNKLAINISNNMINFYDWYSEGKFIGSLASMTRVKDANKSLIELSNSNNSAIAIGYPTSNDDFNSYVEFDKFNISGDSFHKPIKVLEETNFNWEYIYRAHLSNDDKTGWIYVDEDRAEISIGDYFVHCKKDQATIGRNSSAGGNQVVIKDDGIHFYGQLFKGD